MAPLYMSETSDYLRKINNMKTKYIVTYQRVETYRHDFIVEANSVNEAEKIAFDMNEEHEWTNTEMAHADENSVTCRKEQDT